MHAAETVTPRESREDKYSMIDRGERYSCVPLTSSPWLLPAPDLSHLSQPAQETDSFHILLFFTLGIKTYSNFTFTFHLHKLIPSQRGKDISTVNKYGVWSRLMTPAYRCVTDVSQMTCPRCIDFRIVCWILNKRLLGFLSRKHLMWFNQHTGI